MTWVDGIVLAVLALSALIAFFRGLVQEVLGVGAWAGAVLFALYMLPGTGPLVKTWVEPDWLAEIIALGGIFLVALVVLKLMIGWFAGRVRASVLGGLDRALGMVFGLARGAFLVVLAYIVGGLLLPAVDRWPEPVRDARTLPLVADGAGTLVSWLPPEYRPRLPDLPQRSIPGMDELLRPPARGR
ncbi:CvpA family protein [Roseomonas sp. KE0001]|uniref:CvpA family protein n=1 Tax=Roseomonas sp. KE0001 TaxID=2479201 RepID=UPI0018E03C30|nr:CvpA family protein [Roseomonas sp. KE0001]MBI0433735.1 CvpA family protein [Roseomonas sp. KE0001]